MIILFAIWLFVIMLMFKNDNTYKNHIKIVNAITDYSITEHISYDQFSEMLDGMEPYNKTMFRLWDWSPKRIVKRELYEQIKDYLK